jgi:cytochrome c553
MAPEQTLLPLSDMIKASSLLLAVAGVFCTAPAWAQNAARGEKIAQMCIGCHGIPGYQASFPEVHRVPKISGQNSAFIVAALNAYKKGERKHPSMTGIASSLTDADMSDLAAFYEQHGRSSLKAVADTPAVAPSAEVAALLTKGACASCHGANFNKPIQGVYPKIAGQHADYLYVALKAYGTEANPRVGRANAVMSAQVKPFSRKELRLLADYIGSLPGDLQVVPQDRFR